MRRWLARLTVGTRAAGLAACLAAAAFSACAGGVPRPPDGVEAHWLEMRVEPGMALRTSRTFTSQEPVDGGLATARHETAYRTWIEQVDATGQPVAGTRIYDVAEFEIDVPGELRQERSALAGSRIVFRPGLRPRADGEAVPADLAAGLSLIGFEAMLLPNYPVWEGHGWQPPAERMERLQWFLRSLGFIPRRTSATIAWRRTDETPTRAAVLDIDWRVTGTMPTGRGGSVSTRLRIEGTARYEFESGVITRLVLRGTHDGSGAVFHIVLNREVIRDPGPVPNEAPAAEEPAPADDGTVAPTLPTTDDQS